MEDYRVTVLVEFKIDLASINRLAALRKAEDITEIVFRGQFGRAKGVIIDATDVRPLPSPPRSAQEPDKEKK